MDQLGEFFSQQNAKETKKLNEGYKDASSDNSRHRIELPGKFVVSAGSFVWLDKRDDPKNPKPVPSPEVTMTRNNAVMLNIGLNVVDDGDAATPKGSSIFHAITLVPAKGADQKKIDNTIRFAKPQLAALLGHDKIEVSEDWIRQNCTIDYEEKDSRHVIKRDHSLKQKVTITTDFVPDQNNKPRLKVVKLEKFCAGDKSVTYQVDAATTAAAQQTPEVPANVDISPSEEAAPKKAAHMDTSRLTRTEESF